MHVNKRKYCLEYDHLNEECLLLLLKFLSLTDFPGPDLLLWVIQKNMKILKIFMFKFKECIDVSKRCRKR